MTHKRKPDEKTKDALRAEVECLTAEVKHYRRMLQKAEADRDEARRTVQALPGWIRKHYEKKANRG